MNTNVVTDLESALMQDVGARGADSGGRNIKQEMSLLTNLLNSNSTGQNNGCGHHRRTHDGGNNSNLDKTISNLEDSLGRSIASDLQAGQGGTRRAGQEMKLLNNLLQESQNSGGGRQDWSSTNSGNGTGTVDLGRYTLNLNKANSELTLTDKTTGAVTDISGDPHVSENGQSWTFKNNTTFQLADGTALTIKTVPYGNGQTLSDEIDISKGNQSMKITGLAQNSASPLSISEGFSGYQMAASNRGDQVIHEAGNEWTGRSGQLVNQLYATQFLS